MNKFRAWLIRKLGGYVYLAQAQKIVKAGNKNAKFPMAHNLSYTDIYDFKESPINFKEKTDNGTDHHHK